MRKWLAALFVFAATGCTTSLASAVDMAPMYARPSVSPLAAGLYCSVAVSWRPDNEVVSVAAGGRESCRNYSWDLSRRLVIAQALEGQDGKPPESLEIALASLGDGLFLAQTANTDSEGETNEAAPYILFPVLITGAIFSYTSPLEGSELAQLASRFPQVSFATFGETDDRRYIKSGAREDILAFVRDVSLLGLSRPDENGGMTLSLFTRMSSPDPEPVLSVLRRPDVAAAGEAASRLAKLAPAGIELQKPAY